MKARRSGQQAVLVRGRSSPAASSGIGREFARQIAASHINVVLVARRQALLDTLGTELSRDFRGEASRRRCRFSRTRGSSPDWRNANSRTWTSGLVISNAGTGNPGRFTDKDRQELAITLRFEPRFAHAETRATFRPQASPSAGLGGLLFVGAMNADLGEPVSWHMTRPAPRLMSRALAWRSTR